jgi:hypothetical protein
VILICGFRMEREKASVDTDGQSKLGDGGPLVDERERAEAATEGTEYRCGARRRTGS